MKLEQLLEMPKFIDKEAIEYPSVSLFYSEDTVKREFTIIAKKKFDNLDYWVILNKDEDLAAIGFIGIRDLDKKAGLHLVGSMDFKNKPDLFTSKLTVLNSNMKVLQIDGVQIHKKDKFKGLGYFLYTSLADFGYVLISDHIQYRGGKAIWKKLASIEKDNAVYVLKDGNVVEADGVPIAYNGTNIPDSEIWGPDGLDQYNLLVYRKRI